MAANSVIGALRVVLGADTAALDKGLKESQSRISAFGAAVTAGFAAVAAGVAAASIQIVGSVQSAIESADKLNKMSQSTGLTTQELSKLSYAAELADVSTEALGKSMGKLSKAMASAGSDGASPAAQAFKDMGVAVKNNDGTMRSSADVLGDVAEKFKGYRDDANKTALAQELFGKAGAAMIPILNMGRDGLKEMGDEAQRYGLVLDKSTTMAAEAFNDNLKKMDKIKQGVFTTLAAKMLPAFRELSEVLLRSREESTLWNTVGDAVAGVMNKIVASGIALITTWQRIFTTASDVKTALTQLASGDFTGAMETMRKSAAETGAAMVGLGQQIKSIVAPDEMDKAVNEIVTNLATVKGAMDAVEESMKRSAPFRAAVNPEDQKAVDNYIASVYKKTAAMQADAQTVGQSAAAQAYLKTVYEAQAIALAKGIPLTAALNTQIALAGQAAADAALKVQAANALQSLETPYQKLHGDLAQYDLMLQQNLITLEQHRALSVRAAESIGATWQQVGAQAMGSFSQLAASFGKNNKAMGIAAKAFGIGQAIINTQLAVTKALATYGPTPLGYAAVAAAVAQGAASVATISAQGFARGGIVSGPGTSTSDSIPARLSRGEFVVNADATSRNRAALEAMNSGRNAQPSTVNLSLPFATTRDALVQVFDGLNDMMRDGYVLKINPA